MKLANNHTFRAIDDEGTLIRHIGYGTKINILYHSGKILMVRIRAIEFQFCLERHTVCQSPFQAFCYAVLGRIDVVVQKLEDEIVARVCNREILGKHLIKTLVLAVLRWSVEL